MNSQALFDDSTKSKVYELIYWHDPKKSGIVFGSGLVLLLSLAYCSIISVIAWPALLALGLTISFRVYKGIKSAVQKTNEGNPFKDYLSADIKAPKEKVDQVVEILLGYFNAIFVKIQHIFLVEDIFDSIKYFLGLWCLTYIGSWFNGLTLVILIYLAVFSIPKIYEMNKAQIDQHLSLACAQLQNVVTKVKDKLPFGRKEKSQ